MSAPTITKTKRYMLTGTPPMLRRRQPHQSANLLLQHTCAGAVEVRGPYTIHDRHQGTPGGEVPADFMALLRQHKLPYEFVGGSPDEPAELDEQGWLLSAWVRISAETVKVLRKVSIQ